jgi:hypothetical protein
MNLHDPTGHYAEQTNSAVHCDFQAYAGACDHVEPAENWDGGVIEAGVFLISFAPVVGDALDVFDIGMAIVNGNLDEAALLTILSLAPGRAKAVLDHGPAALRAAGMSDELIGKVTRVADDAVGAFCSFSADTLVMTEDGLLPISEVDEETLVLAYNEETGEVGYYPVVAVWAHEDPVIVTLTIEGEVIETTPEHPFYTEEGEWLPADALQIGDEIRTADWGTGTVESIVFIEKTQLMYNFTVATAHTYFVGDGQWLVHNSCWPMPSTIKNNREFGELIGWGIDGVEGKSGGEWALERLENLTIDDIKKFQDAGLTSEMAQQWSYSYLDVHLKNAGNPSAYERAQLMQYIADWLKEIE